MKSVKYLEQLRAKMGNPTNNEMAAKLNITPGGVSHYFNGRRVMDDEACLAVALELGINPMEVIGAACIDRAEKTGQKSLWEVFMNRAAMTAGAVLVASGVNLFLTPSPANAAAMRVSEGTESTMYRLCEIRGRSIIQCACRQYFHQPKTHRLNCNGQTHLSGLFYNNWEETCATRI